MHVITLTFRSGGMHYSATRRSSTAVTASTQKRNRDDEHLIAEDHEKREKSKKVKQPITDKAKGNQKGTSKAQRRAAERLNKRKKQSENVKKVWVDLNKYSIATSS